MLIAADSGRSHDPGLPTAMKHTMGSGVPKPRSLKSAADSVYSSRPPKEDAIDTTTLLIIIVVCFFLVEVGTAGDAGTNFFAGYRPIASSSVATSRSALAAA